MRFFSWTEWIFPLAEILSQYLTDHDFQMPLHQTMCLKLAPRHWLSVSPSYVLRLDVITRMPSLPWVQFERLNRTCHALLQWKAIQREVLNSLLASSPWLTARTGKTADESRLTWTSSYRILWQLVADRSNTSSELPYNSLRKWHAQNLVDV